MANAWITFLTKYYQDRKKKQPGYSYSDAMKDAKIEYNKTKGTSHTKSPKKGKKMRGGSLLDKASPINESTGLLVKEGGDMSTTKDMSTEEPVTQLGGKKSRRKGTKGKKSKKSKKSKKCKSKRKSRSSRK